MSIVHLEQLQEWVDAVWIKELIVLGFKVLMLDVSECLVGEYQIIYKKQNVLQTKDITFFYSNKLLNYENNNS